MNYLRRQMTGYLQVLLKLLWVRTSSGMCKCLFHVWSLALGRVYPEAFDPLVA